MWSNLVVQIQTKLLPLVETQTIVLTTGHGLHCYLPFK
jgi:hypothetical protein